MLVVTETKEDKFWYAALYYFLYIQQMGDFSVFLKNNILVPTNAHITNRRVNSVQILQHKGEKHYLKPSTKVI